MKQIRIYGTLGPASGDYELLKQMFSEGMDGMRLNLSHTSLEESEDLLNAFHRAADACGVRAALLVDMQGPELRIGTLRAPLDLRAGDRIAADAIPFPDAVKNALHDAESDRELLLDDGKILLKTDGSGRLCVVRGGTLPGRKSVALNGLSVRTPALTEEDRRHIGLFRSYGVTGLMQPFVRGAEDLDAVRQALAGAGNADIRLFAKIENAEGMAHLDSLIPCCDEIVIARGDLGNAMPLWKLPAAQKTIAARCSAAGRDFMVVTQMLDSMTHRPVPTRAEVSDIFNAVLDGASSVMVTGETASGEYPLETVRYLAKTVREAETYLSVH